MPSINQRMISGKLRLGKHPARKDDRTLRLAKYTKALPPPPSEMGYIDAVRDWPLYGNDTIGDCTIAAAAHQIGQWTAYANPPEVLIPEDKIIQAYSAVSGYSPNVPFSDVGANELDVLNYWRKTGIGGHRIFAFAAIDPSNFTEIQQAIAIFGSVYIGIGLPVAAQNPRTDENGLPIWEVPAGGPVGNGEPWSWGGHAIPVLGFRAPGLPHAGVRLVSWGQLFDATWNFLAAYMDECYAIVTRDWVEANTKSPSGFDLTQLQADLAQL